jgi:S1-C subfamily serine protease
MPRRILQALVVTVAAAGAFAGVGIGAFVAGEASDDAAFGARRAEIADLKSAARTLRSERRALIAEKRRLTDENSDLRRKNDELTTEATRQQRGASLGAYISDLVGRQANVYRMSNCIVGGVLVDSVVPGGPAALAGLRGGKPDSYWGEEVGGDQILSIDGRITETVNDVLEIVEDHTPGDQVVVQTRRCGRSERIRTVTLGAPHDEPQP